MKILEYLQKRDLFAAEENLINLATSEAGVESVNMHQAFEIGEKLICGMANQLAFSFFLQAQGHRSSHKGKIIAIN